MSCAEFHKTLPFMFESGNPGEQEHLKTCPDCASLVQDLRYIAEQAKLLLPMHDPSPRVWDNIQTSLQKEGLAKSDRMPRPGPITELPRRENRAPLLGWAFAMAAALLLAVALFQAAKKPAGNDQAAVDRAPGAQAGNISQDDSQLLDRVAKSSPALRPMYENSLRNVNRYIADAKASVKQDPSDFEARDHLREAYAQKSRLYDLATARSLEQ